MTRRNKERAKPIGFRTADAAPPSRARRPQAFRIVCSGGPYGTTVELDGKPLRGVRRLEFDHAVGELPRLLLELHPDAVEVEGQADAELQEGADEGTEE